jgi:hypothetical protein
MKSDFYIFDMIGHIHKSTENALLTPRHVVRGRYGKSAASVYSKNNFMVRVYVSKNLMSFCRSKQRYLLKETPTTKGDIFRLASKIEFHVDDMENYWPSGVYTLDKETRQVVDSNQIQIGFLSCSGKFTCNKEMESYRVCIK